jgi:hypothetical protein
MILFVILGMHQNKYFKCTDHKVEASCAGGCKRDSSVTILEDLNQTSTPYQCTFFQTGCHLTQARAIIHAFGVLYRGSQEIVQGPNAEMLFSSFPGES